MSSHFGSVPMANNNVVEGSLKGILMFWYVEIKGLSYWAFFYESYKIDMLRIAIATMFYNLS